MKVKHSLHVKTGTETRICAFITNNVITKVMVFWSADLRRWGPLPGRVPCAPGAVLGTDLPQGPSPGGSVRST